jgi:hypothetical protein
VITGLWRWSRRALIALLILVVLLAAYVQFGGHRYFWTALKYTYLQGHNTAHIGDATNFPQAVVASGIPKPWAMDPRAAQTAISADLLPLLTAEHTASCCMKAISSPTRPAAAPTRSPWPKPW